MWITWSYPSGNYFVHLDRRVGIDSDELRNMYVAYHAEKNVLDECQLPRFWEVAM